MPNLYEITVRFRDGELYGRTSVQVSATDEHDAREKALDELAETQPWDEVTDVWVTKLNDPPPSPDGEPPPAA
jgi:hypothetical protein